MPQVYQKGAISFGLVYIPVSLYTATQGTDVPFHQLHKEDYGRVRYKKVCSECEQPLEMKDIVKGYEYEKGEYVVLEEEDFASVRSPKDKSIAIEQFTDLSAVDPIYFERSYYAVPAAGGEKAFELLRRSMEQEGKAAIARWSASSREMLLCLIARDLGIVAMGMHFAAEVREVPQSYSVPEISDKEMELAKTLLKSMAAPFDASAYRDTYQDKLRALIEQKLSGKEGKKAQPQKQANIIDLMEALRMSVEQGKPKAKASASKKRKSAS